MDAATRIRVLIEALPYIQRFHAKVIVVKCGGSALKDPEIQHGFARDVVLLKQVGLHPVVLHGGGPRISQALGDAQIEHRFVHGIRQTSHQAMQIVDRCLRDINRELCQSITDFGGQAQGLASDARIVRAQKLILDEAPDEDLGHAGKVAGIRPDFASLAVQAKIPVISPVGQDDEGTLFNVNADSAAAGIAASLCAEKLVLLSDIPGVLDQQGELVPRLSAEQAHAWVHDGVITGGMLPKIRCAFAAIDAGVHAAHIIDGRKPHALLLELLTDAGVGTLIHALPS